MNSGTRGFRAKETVRSSFLIVPGGIAVTAAVVGGAVGRIDSAITKDEPAPGGPGSGLLTAIAGGSATLIAVVFSITMLVLQLSSSQFSPRVLRTFLRDRTSQVTLGVLAGTFAYAVVALRSLDPHALQSAPLSATGAILLALGSLAVFVIYIDHIAHKIQVTSVLESITNETAGVIVRRFPDEPPPPAKPVPRSPPDSIVTSPGRGYIRSVAADQLVQIASEQDVLLVLRARIGEFVPDRSALFDVHGPASVKEEDVHRQVSLGAEPSMEQDVAFGIRQLVDIAVRAMSPALNDMTTAVQAVDHLRELLRRLARAPFATGHHCDEQGQLRLVIPQAPWDDYLRMAVDEVMANSGGSNRIRVALEVLLADVASVATEEHRPPVLERLERVSPGRASAQSG